MNLNELAIRVINILIQSPGVSHIPDGFLNVTAVQEYELSNANITLDDWKRIVAPLVLCQYIKPISQLDFDTDVEEYLTSVFTALGLTPKYIESLPEKEKQEALSKLAQKGKDMFGVDTSLIDDNSLTSDTELKTPIITNETSERVIKSPIVGRYKLLKDLRKLQKKLQKGFEFENLGKGNIIYKPDIFTLFIGIERINIKPTVRTPTEHYILDYISLSESIEYFYSELETDVKIAEKDVKTKKQHKEAIRNLIEKIEIQTEGRITDFITSTTKSFKINPDYLEED